MSLFKGTSRVASGGVDQTLNTEDLTNHTVTFVDDGDCSGYSDADEITDSISTGSQIGTLFSLIKKGLKFVSDKFSEYLPLTGGTMTGSISFKNTDSYVAINKYRTIDDIEYQTSIGLGSNSSIYGTSSALELRSSADDYASILNRLDIGADGEIYTTKTGNGTYKLYGEHNKSSMPFLPISGGTLTGRLTIKPGTDWTQITMYDADGTRLHKIHCSTTADSHSSMQFEVNRDGTNDNRTLLSFKSMDNGSVPSNAIWFTNYVDGTATSYNIWGDHNRSSMVLPDILKMLNSEGTTAQVMRLYADSDSTTAYGNELLIGANGTVYIGGGESHTNLYGAIGGSTGENLYLSSDANIMLAPNCNTIANRKPIWITSSQFYPATSGTHTLGTSTYKWGQIYSTASSISTSDRNQKNSIESLDDKAVQLILNVPTVSYKFNDGTSGRKHWGMIAQDVEEVMNELEISSSDFAAFIKSPKEKIESEATGELVLDLDEDGNIQYGYALRYEEFIAPLIKTVQEQQKQIEALQQAVINLGGQV